MDGIRGVVQEDVGILRAEIQKYLSTMMEQIEFIRGKWEGMEVDRKEKGVAFGSETNTTPEGPFKINVARVKSEDRERREEVWKGENQSRKLEIPIFNGEDSDVGISSREVLYHELLVGLGKDIGGDNFL